MTRSSATDPDQLRRLLERSDEVLSRARQLLAQDSRDLNAIRVSKEDTEALAEQAQSLLDERQQRHAI